MWSWEVSDRGYAALVDMNEVTRARLIAETRRAVAEQLRAERAAQKLTVDAAASAVGMNRKTVMRLESGERDPSTDQLAAFCAVYGLSLTEFMGRVEQRISQARARTVADDARNVIG